ncbi:MAG: SpoIIE family protein phosphatase [Ruminococcus sp.]|nr:SpoIIE family protein phosphatase [Ruminococcus sp.]
MISFTAAVLLYILLNDWDDSRFYFGVSPVIAMTVCIAINIIFRKKCYTWIMYLNNAVILYSTYMLCGYTDTIAALFILIPLLNSFYYRPHLTVISSVIGFFLMYVIILSVTTSYYNADNMIDNNILRFIPVAFNFSDENVILILRSHSLLMIIGAALMIVSIYLSIGGQRHAIKQGKLIAETITNQAELETARNIQEGFLSTDFPDHSSYAVCADMTPAAEVGGDFYDYFTVDDTHIAVVIGDVSGHGMAAALFMTLTKTLLKVYAQAGYPTDKVMANVNRYLQKSNPEKLFVTGWIGILDLTNGILSYTNAGHNPPILIHSSGETDYLQSVPNFVLGRRRRVSFTEEQIKLSAGDKLILYTDGVTEAQSPDEDFFGDEQLLTLIRYASNQEPSELVHTIRSAVDNFEDGGAHYDDATILTLFFKEYLKVEPMKSKTFFLNKESFDSVLSYIEACCLESGCDEETVGQITIACSEILSNLDSYAYENGGNVEIQSKCRDNRMTLIFRDNGQPFDPLRKQDPDVTLPLSERRRGGLGIYIVKKLMSDVSYEYIDHQNVLTVTKDF